MKTEELIERIKEATRDATQPIGVEECFEIIRHLEVKEKAVETLLGIHNNGRGREVFPSSCRSYNYAWADLTRALAAEEALQ